MVPPKVCDQNSVQQVSSRQTSRKGNLNSSLSLSPLRGGSYTVQSVKSPRQELHVHLDHVNAAPDASSESHPSSSKENQGAAGPTESAKSVASPSLPLRPRPNSGPMDLSSSDVTDSPHRSPIRKSSKEIQVSLTRLTDFDELDDEWVPPEEDEEPHQQQTFSHPIAILTARGRAEPLSNLAGSGRNIHTAATSPLSSGTTSRASSPDSATPSGLLNNDYLSIPLIDLNRKQKHAVAYEANGGEGETGNSPKSKLGRFAAAAKRLVRDYSSDNPNLLIRVPSTGRAFHSGQSGSVDEYDQTRAQYSEKYNRGILGSILKIRSRRSTKSTTPSGPEITPYSRDRDISGDSSRTLKGPAAQARPGVSPNVLQSSYEIQSPTRTPNSLSPPKPHSLGDGSSSSLTRLTPSSMWGSRHQVDLSDPFNLTTPPRTRQRSGGVSETYYCKAKPKVTSASIEVHIENELERQAVVTELCEMMLGCGYPSYEIEKALKQSARILQLDGQFLYIPHYMLVSFSDRSTHTSEVKIIYSDPEHDLGKIDDLYKIYEEIVSASIGAKEALKRLCRLRTQEVEWTAWSRILAWGFASAFVGLAAFQANLLDLPIIFVLGCIGGVLNTILTRFGSFRRICEMGYALFITFVARWLGSIGTINGREPFCFSAITKSSISIILPGYTLLSGILELQYRNLAAGTARVFYAIVYSLFLGYGITLGATAFGSTNKHAISDIRCKSTSSLLNGITIHIVSTAVFTVCLAFINLGKLRQMPVMVSISVASCVVAFYSARSKFKGQLASTFTSLTIGILGHIYARFSGRSAIAAILPAIWVQVPSGLAAAGSLREGIYGANRYTGENTTSALTNATGRLPVYLNKVEVDIEVFEVAYSMIQFAIGLSMGLLLSDLFMAILILVTKWMSGCRRWKRKVFSF